MDEFYGRKQLTGLARSIDELFAEQAPDSPSDPALRDPEDEALAASADLDESSSLPVSEEAGPPPLPEEASPPPLPEEASPPPLPEEASPPPLPEEASPPPPPEEASPPPLPTDAGPPPLPAESGPPPLPEEAALPQLPEAPAPPSSPSGAGSSPSPVDDASVPAPLPAGDGADGDEEEEEPTELDLAVDAWLDGDRDRAGEIERLAAERIEARDVAPVARSVARIAFAAGEPPETSMLAVAESISSPVVLGRLARIMGGERDGEKRREYFQVCRVLGPDMARAVRDDLAENTDSLARSVHCEALVEMGAVGRPIVEEMAEDEIWFLARNGVAILGDIGGDRAVELVTGALANPDARVRREALRSLARLGATESGELIVGLLDDSDEGVRQAATVAAAELKVERAVRPLIAMLEANRDPDHAIPIIRALGQLEDPGAVPVLEKHAVPSLFSKPRTDVRVAAYRALYHIGTPHAMKLLAKASSDKDSIVQSAVLGLRKSVDREG